LTATPGPERQPERVPFGQALLDDFFLLTALGLLIPFLSYLVWGLLDLGSVPVLPGR
jgi:hypothetical protein